VARLDVVRAAPAEGPTSTYGTVISDKPDDMLTVRFSTVAFFIGLADSCVRARAITKPAASYKGMTGQL
jgi:hypothetical protein